MNCEFFRDEELRAEPNLFIEFVYRETCQCRTEGQMRRVARWELSATQHELRNTLIQSDDGQHKVRCWKLRGLEKAHITKVRFELRSKLNERKLK